MWTHVMKTTKLLLFKRWNIMYGYINILVSCHETYQPNISSY